MLYVKIIFRGANVKDLLLIISNNVLSYTNNNGKLSFPLLMDSPAHRLDNSISALISLKCPDIAISDYPIWIC